MGPTIAACKTKIAMLCDKERAKDCMVCSTYMYSMIIAVEVSRGVKIDFMLFSGHWKQAYRAQSG